MQGFFHTYGMTKSATCYEKNESACGTTPPKMKSLTMVEPTATLTLNVSSSLTETLTAVIHSTG